MAQDYPIQFGRYLLLERIAVGGMAEIFRSMSRSIEGVEKVVAVKRILPEYSLDEEFVSLFIDEARISATLQHPNLVHVYDFGKQDRSYYIAMEYVDGPNLKNFVRKLYQAENAFPIEFAIYIIIQLLKALDYLYRATDAKDRPLFVIHRDISPQNILLSREGEVKITDFGIAKSASKLSKTVPGKIQGKFGYMSPEQAMGKELDHRSDLFSLGIIFFEMLTGKRLYGGENTFIRYENVKEARVQPVSKFRDVPEALDRIVTKMLQKDPDARYQTSAELQKDLTDFLYPANTETVISGLSTAINKYFPKQQSQDREVAGKQESEKKRWWQRRFSKSAKSSATEAPTSRTPNDNDASTLSMQQPDAVVEPKTNTVPVASVPTGLLADESSQSSISSKDAVSSGVVSVSGHTVLAPEALGDLSSGSFKKDLRADLTPAVDRRKVIELPVKKSGTRADGGRTGSARSLGLSTAAGMSSWRDGLNRILVGMLVLLLVLLGARLLLGKSNGWVGDLFSPFTGSKLRNELTSLQEQKTQIEQNQQAIQAELQQTKQRLLDLIDQRTMDNMRDGSANDSIEKKLRDLEGQFNREQERWDREKKGYLAQIDALKAQLAEATSKCPKEMVYIPSGKFFFGSAADDPERNLGESLENMEQSKEYCVDRYEYPNVAGKIPKAVVTWQEAVNICESQGKRLCNEREWERACKGPKNQRYLYGNLWEEGMCNTEDKKAKDGLLVEAGEFKNCVNEFGIFDMSGNVSEWTDTSGNASAGNPVLRGGSYDRAGYWSRCASRLESTPESKSASVGFRCCRDVR